MRLGTRQPSPADAAEEAPRTAEVARALDALLAAIELAEGRLPQETVEMARQVADKAAVRLRHGSEHTLVAVLGATGGGKSTLVNALVGADVAPTGVRRPTTSSTLACYWGEDDATPLLDWLEVGNRHDVGPSDELGGLILLDVPDYDSVREANRLEMERIAEHADLLLWVTDPEKYGDAAMHAYLARLSGHGAVMAMVLNKADTLPPEQMGHCRADLMLLLQDAGLYETEVLTAAAATDPPQVERVRALLVRAVAERRAMTDRLRADVGHAANELMNELGSAPADHAVATKTADVLARDLVDATGLDPVCQAVEAGHRRDAGALTGWPFTRWARRLRPHPLRRLRLQEGAKGRSSLPEPSGIQRTRTDGAIRDAVATAARGLDGSWTDVLRRAATPDPNELADRLETAVASAVRTSGQRRPRWWRLVNVLQLVLAAAVVAGALWLGLLALGAYLQLPEIPTPSYRRIPIPTGLLIGGAVLGLVLMMVSRRFAAIGARRRSRAVRRSATSAVALVSEELVVDPMRRELANRGELHRLLTEAATIATAGGRRRGRRRR